MKKSGRPSLKTPGVEFWLGAVPDKELGRIVGASGDTVRRWRYGAKILHRSGRPTGIPASDYPRLVKLVLKLQNIREVARVMGVPWKIAMNHVAKAGLRSRWVLKALMILLVPSWLLW